MNTAVLAANTERYETDKLVLVQAKEMQYVQYIQETAGNGVVYLNRPER